MKPNQMIKKGSKYKLKIIDQIEDHVSTYEIVRQLLKLPVNLGDPSLTFENVRQLLKCPSIF